MLHAREVLGLGLARRDRPVRDRGIVVVRRPRRNRARRITLALTMSAWCAALTVATLRHPPSRVWIFLLPIACTYVGAGMAALARSVAAIARGIPERVISTAGALALAATIGTTTITSRAVFESEETDFYGLREASAISEFLVPRLQTDERIVIGINDGLSLDYYLMLAGPRLTQFDPTKNHGRLYVVVNTRHRQTLKGLKTARADVSWNQLDSAGMVGAGSARV